jgi:hypothetical protein
MALTHPLSAQSLAATYAAAKTENYGKVRKMAKNPGRNSRRNRNVSEPNGRAQEPPIEPQRAQRTQSIQGEGVH